MNKREIIHALIDKLLDIEESSQKGLGFSYGTALGMDFRFYTRPNNFGDYVRDRVSLYELSKIQFEDALKEIELIKNTPDVEPKISVLLTEAKAKELGLIA